MLVKLKRHWYKIIPLSLSIYLIDNPHYTAKHDNVKFIDPLHPYDPNI